MWVGVPPRLASAEERSVVLSTDSTNLQLQLRPGEERGACDVWSGEQEVQGRFGELPPPTAHVNHHPRVPNTWSPTPRGESMHAPRRRADSRPCERRSCGYPAVGWLAESR